VPATNAYAPATAPREEQVHSAFNATFSGARHPAQPAEPFDFYEAVRGARAQWEDGLSGLGAAYWAHQEMPRAGGGDTMFEAFCRRHGV
jgi:hypothetical protein